MDLKLRFPVFLVASIDGVMVINTNGRDCVMLFHSKELADQQIQKIMESNVGLGPLQALEVATAPELAEGLRELPADVTCAVWDPTGARAGFTHVSIAELICIAGG